MTKKQKASKMIRDLAAAGYTMENLLEALEMAEGMVAEDAAKPKADIEVRVSKILKNLGMPCNICGYGYIRYAIILAYHSPEMLKAITKELYPSVARKFNTTTTRAERAIRHSIEVAWDRGNIEAFTEMFGYTVSMHKGKPTNSEFISLIANELHMEDKQSN